MQYKQAETNLRSKRTSLQRYTSHFYDNWFWTLFCFVLIKLGKLLLRLDFW